MGFENYKYRRPLDSLKGGSIQFCVPEEQNGKVKRKVLFQLNFNSKKKSILSSLSQCDATYANEQWRKSSRELIISKV